MGSPASVLTPSWVSAVPLRQCRGPSQQPDFSVGSDCSSCVSATSMDSQDGPGDSYSTGDGLTLPHAHSSSATRPSQRFRMTPTAASRASRQPGLCLRIATPRPASRWKARPRAVPGFMPVRPRQHVGPVSGGPSRWSSGWTSARVAPNSGIWCHPPAS